MSGAAARDGRRPLRRERAGAALARLGTGGLAPSGCAWPLGAPRSSRGSAVQELLIMLAVYIMAVGTLSSFMSMQHRQYAVGTEFERSQVTGREVKSFVDTLSDHNGTVRMRMPCNANETVSIEPITTGDFILLIGEQEVARSVLRVHPAPNTTIDFARDRATIAFDLSKEAAERMSNVTCTLGFQDNPNPSPGCERFLDQLLHIFLEGNLYRSIYICESLHCRAATTLRIQVNSPDDDQLREDFNKIRSILEHEGKQLSIAVTNRLGQRAALTAMRGTLQSLSVTPATCGLERHQELCASSTDGGCP